MVRAVENAEEKMSRVKVETTEILADAVAVIAKRVLDQRLDPFVSGARDSAAKLATVARSLESVEAKVQRKLADFDAKIEDVKAAAGIQELQQILGETKAALDLLQRSNRATLEAVTQTARTARADLARARRVVIIGTLLSALALTASTVAVALHFLAR